MRGDQREVNPLMEINPADIESIEIIKGPAAATLYGTEASAGVIQIITKRGAQGDAQFDMSVRQGINYMRDPAGRLGIRFACTDILNGVCDDVGDPYGFDKEGDDRDYSSRRGTLVSYDPYLEANRILVQSDRAWFDEGSGVFEWPQPELYQNGNSQSYNLEVRGGTPAVRYYLSGNYDDDRGIVFYNTDEKYRLRGNVSVVFSDQFTLDVSTGYVDGKSSFMQQARGQGGEWDDLQWGGGFCIVSLNIDQCPRLPGPFQEHMPPDVASVEVTRDYSRFTGSGTLNFTLGEWLRSRAIVGVDKGWDENNSYYPRETRLTVVYPESPTGQVTIERPITTNISADWSATARYRPIEAFGTSTSVGFQYYIETFEMLANTGAGFPSSASRTVNQTPASRATLVYEYRQDKSLGLYVQEEISVNDRIFLTAAIRFDDNSAFGSEFDLEKYPKLAATWTVSDEAFWSVDAVNSLRVRGAWGKAGRQPDTFAGRNQYGVIPGPGGTSAFQPSSPGNLEVGPEVSTEIELGLDVALFDDRIATEFTYFYTKNEDALLNVPLAPSVGFRGSQQINLGQIDKWGWEATLNAQLYQSRMINVGVDVTASSTKNEIKEMGTFAPTNTIRLGWPYPNLTANSWILSAQWAPAGDPRRLPQNAWGDKVVAQCDAGVLTGDTSQHGRLLGGEVVDCATITPGNPVLLGPRFYQYQASISPNVSLFNNALRLHVLMDGGWGMWRTDGGVGSGDQYNNTYYSRTENDPKYVAGNRCGTCYTGQVNQFDADYIKLREIGANYTLPESLASRVGAQRASLAFSMREVATLWAAQDEIWYATVSDPELGGARTDDTLNRQIPGFSSASLTLRVSF
jgi:TonB-dependent SusC/RagA subfamily outer membrane receptor